MASDGWVPEIVVGVDFGMTCTGEFDFLRRYSLEAIQLPILGLLKNVGASRCRVFHGPGLGRAKDPPTLAWQDDKRTCE